MMDTPTSVQIIALIIVCYTLYGAIYRLYLSPVASFPGPKLAAVTFWYEFYYDVIKRGRYTWKIEELHKQYGPIIRINPYEIHVIDPDFYDELYVGHGKRRSELWPWSAVLFGTPDSMLTTIDHDVHRRRRGAYERYFSKQAIRNYSDVIQAAVDKLCMRMRQISQSGNPVNLWHVYSAMTADIVTGYCFPESYGLLDQPDCGTDLHKMFASTVSNAHLVKFVPFLFPLVLKLPRQVATFLLPAMAHTISWQDKWFQQINELRTTMDDGKARGGKASIFRTVLDSDLPAEDKTSSHLVGDAQTLLAGGSVTTTAALSLATYYILSDEHILKRFMNELTEAIPDPTRPLSLDELERLEYLSAITMESLRISNGVMHRLQRICPDQPLHYHNWVIPAGTPVSMSVYLVQMNPDIFPDPDVFKPERWLPLETEGRRLQKYLVAFSKGSRSCLGLTLAWAELYMTLAGVFRNLGSSMKVVDTVKERDVAISRDLFTPVVRDDTTGIKVVISESNT